MRKRDKQRLRNREARRRAALAGEYGELLRKAAEGIDDMYRKLEFINRLENASEGPVRIRVPVTYTVSSTGDDDE